MWHFFRIKNIVCRVSGSVFHCISEASYFPYINVKVKVKLSLCLTKHHAMKTYWGSGGIAPRILDLGTSWR
jgi:hypothetical protein